MSRQPSLLLRFWQASSIITDGDLLASWSHDLDPVLVAVKLPAQPSMLVEDSYLDLLAEMSAVLGDLVTDSNS